MVSLHKEFGSLLEQSYISKQYVKLPKFSLLKFIELLNKCNNPQDVDKLNHFINSIKFRMRSRKFLFSDSFVSMAVLVHRLELGPLIQKEVLTDSFFNPTPFLQEFYDNCHFKLSFSFSINNETLPSEFLELDESKYNCQDKIEDVSLESLSGAFDAEEDEENVNIKQEFNHYVLL